MLKHKSLTNRQVTALVMVIITTFCAVGKYVRSEEKSYINQITSVKEELSHDITGIKTDVSEIKGMLKILTRVDGKIEIVQNDPKMEIVQNDPKIEIVQNDPKMEIVQNDPHFGESGSCQAQHGQQNAR